MSVTAYWLPAIFRCLVWMTNDVANPPSGHELERRLAESWPAPEWCDTHVVLAVSGGADSVAMLRAMAALKTRHGGRGQLYVAHLNHGLRGSAADADEGWLRSLCERLKLMLEIERIDVSAIAAEQGDGWEAAARSARYDFLRTAAERVGGRDEVVRQSEVRVQPVAEARRVDRVDPLRPVRDVGAKEVVAVVVTAHTASDQVETVVHRVLRGTGIEGLAGMVVARPLTPSISLVRPMLTLTRDDVLKYLTAIRQDFCTDATNQDTQWTRNRLRHELLPHLCERYNQQVDAALLRLAAQAGEAQQVIAELAATLAKKCIDAKSSKVKVDCVPLRGQPAIVVREVFKSAWRQACWGEQSMGFDEWQQLAALAAGEGLQMFNLPGGRRAQRDGQFVVVDVLAR